MLLAPHKSHHSPLSLHGSFGFFAYCCKVHQENDYGELSECKNPLFFPQSDTCFKCCNCFLQDHIRTRYSLNKTYRMSCHLWTGPPQKPAFQFLLCLCLCVAKLTLFFYFFCFFVFLPPKTSGISIKERQRTDGRSRA